MNQLTCSTDYDRENERIKKIGHDEYGRGSQGGYCDGALDLSKI